MIDFDYARAIKQAKEIEGAARELDELCKGGFDKTRSILHNAWKGEAADLYQQNLSKLDSDMKNEARALRSVAVQIRNIAETYKKAEQKAKEEIEKQRKC